MAESGSFSPAGAASPVTETLAVMPSSMPSGGCGTETRTRYVRAVLSAIGATSRTVPEALPGSAQKLTCTAFPTGTSARRFSGTLISTSSSPVCTSVMTVCPAATTCPSSAVTEEMTPEAPAVRFV